MNEVEFPQRSPGNAAHPDRDPLPRDFTNGSPGTATEEEQRTALVRAAIRGGQRSPGNPVGDDPDPAPRDGYNGHPGNPAREEAPESPVEPRTSLPRRANAGEPARGQDSADAPGSAFNRR